MKNPLVSVIMPVYGVEKYLDKAINSVIKQTYKNWELILVDDKSPDKCPEICDQYALTDDRIKVIHKPINQGISLARNTGLDNATGDYILFVDSDDYIENNLLEIALQACNNETQIIIFGFNRIFEDKQGNTKKTERISPIPQESLSSKDVIDIFLMLTETKTIAFVWNRLYKRTFIEEKNTRFPNIKPTEDFLFNMDLLQNTVFIKVISDNLYNYRKPAHETLTSAYSPDFFDICKKKYNSEKIFMATNNADNNRNMNIIYFSFVKHIISTFIKNNSKKANLSTKQQLEKIKEILNDKITIEVLENYKPNGIVIKIISVILKKKWYFLCYILAFVASHIL